MTPDVSYSMISSFSDYGKGTWRMPKSTSRRKVVSSLTVEQAAESWYRSLEAANRSESRLRTVRFVIELLREYLEQEQPERPERPERPEARGEPVRLVDITKRDIEGWLIALRRRYADSTTFLFFTVARAYFRWCVDEEEIEHSPMARVLPPRTVEQPPTFLSREQVAALLKTCTGKSFFDRRDRAILLLLVDTGMRLHEIAQLSLEAVDLKTQTLAIIGKGRRPRTPHFDKAAAAALDTYLRARMRYVDERPQYQPLHALWLGKKGTFGKRGIYEMVRRRAREAGLGDVNVHPHLFRHGFAHDWLSAGGSEGGLARMAGWTPGSTMIYRYGAAQAEERAREEHGRISPANRLTQPQPPETKPKR